jgi:3-hydroxy-9,10-secoandrosta-1,3,5(10)-triene-9,17-dione monooxygenase
MSGQEAQKVIDGVRELLPVLRERAQETEDARNVPEDSIKSLAELGFFKLLQPRSYDGLEASPLDFFRAVKLIASACGSTGWVSSVLGVHPWQLALFDARAQQDVWGEDTDIRISSSYAPMGRAKPVEGGFQFSGRWSFSSGCAHASWVFVGGLVLGEDGSPVDFRTFLVPISDYTIEDVWDTVGLRGTGSNDIIIDDVFVPEYRTLSFTDTAKCVCPGHEVNKAAIYKVPFASVFSCSISLPIIGMARGAYEAFTEYTKERVRASSGAKASEDVFGQMAVAEAANLIDIAWLQIERNIGEELELAAAGEKIPMSLRLRARRDQVSASGAAIKAVDRLFENSGGKALRNGTPIQRFWRDAHAGRAHVINDPEKTLAMYGQSELGLRVTDAWL